MCESEHERDFFFSSNTGVLDETRVPGLGQITLVNRVLTKNEGLLGNKIARESRNSCRASGGGVGAHGQLIRSSNGLGPRTKYKRSKNAFAVISIALSCSRV